MRGFGFEYGRVGSHHAGRFCIAYRRNFQHSEIGNYQRAFRALTQHRFFDVFRKRSQDKLVVKVLFLSRNPEGLRHNAVGVHAVGAGIAPVNVL